MDLGLLIERGAGRLALRALGMLAGAAGFSQRAGHAPCNCRIVQRLRFCL